MVTAIDFRIQCVPLVDVDYADQISGINTRVNDVIDQLRLEPDGSFSATAFCANLGADLKANVLAYETRAKNLKSEIEANVAAVVDLSANVNPKRNY